MHLLIVLSVLAEPRALFAHPPSRRGTTELVPSSIYSHFSTLMCRTHCRQGRWLCSQVGMPSPPSHQVRLQARALYTAQGPPALPHAHFGRISADPNKEELEYFMASTKPINITSDSQADRDIQQLLTQWRESNPPNTARLTERDEEEGDPDTIDHTPPYAPEDEIRGPPARRTRTRMRGRFRPNPPPARPRHHPGYTVIRHDNE